MYSFNYITALYRKNNYGEPCVWAAEVEDDLCIKIHHGILNKTITTTKIYSERGAEKEIKSKIEAKRKTGYKYLYEVKDDSKSSPVEGELYQFLLAYLPEHRTTKDGSLLPMLAKTYDNNNNKLFKKVSGYLGQYKINGLRCFISAEANSGDLFKPVRLKFQSREGTYWNSLHDLEDYILANIDQKLLVKMIDEHYILDGELYLPGHSVNEINHFVKDPDCVENKMLQYWCYDIAIEEMNQSKRLNELLRYTNRKTFISRNAHFRNEDRFISLCPIEIVNNQEALDARNAFIDLGFEGLILRNPDAEYQFGKRNQSMIKFKKSTDGKFIIIDIKPEGSKRPDIPIFICKNDINDELFEVHVGGTLDYQRQCLLDKDNLIGKYMFVEYGERSGINDLPFHVKTTYIM